MQVSRYTDYAYRVLLYLAVNDNKRVSMAEISAYYQISHEHLRKVVHHLSKIECIQTYTGKSGGMELKKKPEKINLAQIFLEFEGQAPIIDCLQTSCPLIPSCSLSQVMAKAQNMFIQELKQHTIADLVHNPKMVRILAS
jgi:Rrf2 family nitric oxide-sensitive transcriptional repressor